MHHMQRRGTGQPALLMTPMWNLTYSKIMILDLKQMGLPLPGRYIPDIHGVESKRTTQMLLGLNMERRTE